MSAVVDLDRDLDRVLGLAALAVGARSVALFLLAEDGERLRCGARVEGEGTAIDREAAPVLGEGVDRPRRQTRRPALFTNLAPGSLRPPLYGDATPVPSLLVVPVSESGVFRGVLVADAAAPGAFGSEHERMLAGFAGEIGVAARGRARRRRPREARPPLRDPRFISQALSSTIKIDEMLAKMVDLTREIVPYDRCALFIADPAGTSLVLRAQRGFLAAGAEEVRIPLDDGLAGYIAARPPAALHRPEGASHRKVEIVPGAPRAGAHPLLPRPAAAPPGGARRGLGAGRRASRAASTPTTSTSSRWSRPRPRP